VRVDLSAFELGPKIAETDSRALAREKLTPQDCYRFYEEDTTIGEC
jgi:hypothetical protein